MTIKIPVYEEFLKFDGAHCRRLWAQVGPGFVCPVCQRTKFQIYRWTVRNPGKPNQFEGWIAVLHRHHDHADDRWVFGRQSRARFPETVICDQCNAADGIAKKRLGLPQTFSFAPWEIAMFISATPHGQHKLNFDIAQALYAVACRSRPRG